jgi:hypothetical protein
MNRWDNNIKPDNDKLNGNKSKILVGPLSDGRFYVMLVLL